MAFSFTEMMPMSRLYAILYALTVFFHTKPHQLLKASTRHTLSNSGFARGNPPYAKHTPNRRTNRQWNIG